MHILLIHQAFAALDEPGGTRHHELARYLADVGHRVTVIASPISYLTGSAGDSAGDQGGRSPGEEGVTVLRAYTYPALHRSFFHRVLSFFSFMFSSFLTGLRVRKVDLVWGTSPPIFQGVTAWALARLKGAPFLFEVRDLWPAFAVAVGVLRQPILIKTSEWLERFLYRRADQVVVNSPGFLDHVRERGAKQVELVPNGSDLRMFDPEATGVEFRRAHGFANKFIALYAGAHGMSNDLRMVLEAANLLRDQENIHIVFLGDGKEKPALIALAAEMELQNVSFLAPVPKLEMPGALAAADACLATLKPIEMYKTVYPNKVFDYMAAGRPVVLAIDGVIREVVEAAGAGIPVTPGDPEMLAAAIRKLSMDSKLGLEMGARGRLAVEARFDRLILADKMTQLMLSLVEDRD